MAERRINTAHWLLGRSPVWVLELPFLRMPPPQPPPAVTIMLNGAESNDDRLRQLLPLVYDQLRAAAQNQMGRERANHTLGATALVHEAYLKLVGPREIPWQNRAHFYIAAAQAMRQILLDHAKAKHRIKRGGKAIAAPQTRIEDAATLVGSEKDDNAVDLVALDAAIRRLEERDPRVAQVVYLKYYAGLEITQVALALGISERTVKNDWAFARAWLERTLRDDTSDQGK